MLDAVAELGYVPLRAGRQSAMRLETHGSVLHSLGGPYYSELLMGHESTASGFGQSVTAMSAESTPDLEIRVRDLAGRVDGLVIGHATVSDEVVAEVARRVPVVLLGRGPVEGCATVEVDNMEPMVELVAHVVQHGRRHFRFVGEPSAARDVEARYAGYLQALSEAGLREAAEPYRVEFTEQAARAVVDDVLSHPGSVDALVCANDELALAVTRGLALSGVDVPQQVAVTGWDDIMAARYTVPGLTTVHQPVSELGVLLSRSLHDRIAGGPVTTVPALRSELVIRGTCGCRETF